MHILLTLVHFNADPHPGGWQYRQFTKVFESYRSAKPFPRFYFSDPKGLLLCVAPTNTTGNTWQAHLVSFHRGKPEGFSPTKQRGCSKRKRRNERFIFMLRITHMDVTFVGRACDYPNRRVSKRFNESSWAIKIADKIMLEVVFFLSLTSRIFLLSSRS